MNVDFINPFVESIDNILVTMASMSCEYGKPYLKPDEKALGVVTGIIPMSGESVRGSLAISFSAGAATSGGASSGPEATPAGRIRLACRRMPENPGRASWACRRT